MTNGGRWLRNFRETELWDGPDGGGWLMKLPQFSTLRQVRDQQGGRIEVFYSGRGQVPGMHGWAEATDLGPVGPPVTVPPEQPGFVNAPGGGGPWLQNFRVTELMSAPSDGTSAGQAPQFSTYAQTLKQNGPRIRAFYYGNGTLPAGEYWIQATDLGPIPQPTALPPGEPPSPRDTAGQRPSLDYVTGPPAVFNSKPEHFQVIDEGNRFWHLNEAEFDENFFADCGPIAVAHAVNFTNWAKEKDETINAHDGIVASKAAGAYGFHAPAGSFLTVNPPRLARAIGNLTNMDLVVSQNSLDFDTALKLARTRWIIVDNFSGPGHISIVVAFLDGSEQLALVQHRVNHGGVLDAGDLIITRSEWGGWNDLTIHPTEPLWDVPAGQDA